MRVCVRVHVLVRVCVSPASSDANPFVKYSGAIFCIYSKNVHCAHVVH